jgi:hypothetical protein
MMAIVEALATQLIPRDVGARIVRMFPDLLLSGIERVEWGESQENLFFAIAMKPTTDGSFRAAVGTLTESMAALLDEASASAGASTTLCFLYVNIRRVLNAVNETARKANIDLGGKFTRPRAHAEHPEWLAEIARYRQEAIDRQKARDRARWERKRATRKAQAKV